ncbi:hypothetical protein HDU97_008724, partial [Phlyctochytrium planicorne]
PETLSQFNSLITKYESLTNELQATLLKQLILHPKNVDREDPERIPRVFLRTKLIPQIEQVETDLIAGMDMMLNGNAVNGTSTSSTNGPAKFDENMIQIDLHDELCQFAGETYEGVSADYNFKARLESVEEMGGADEVKMKGALDATMKFLTHRFS